MYANGDEPVEGKEEFIEQKKEEVEMHYITFPLLASLSALASTFQNQIPFFLLIF